MTVRDLMATLDKSYVMVVLGHSPSGDPERLGVYYPERASAIDTMLRDFGDVEVKSASKYKIYVSVYLDD